MGKQFHVGDDFAGGVDMSGQATTENQHGEMIELRRTATMNNKRVIAEIYDECRIEGFVDDASVVQKVLTKVLEKSATSETSKKLFLRSQLQSLRKELGRIAEVCCEVGQEYFMSSDRLRMIKAICAGNIPGNDIQNPYANS